MIFNTWTKVVAFSVILAFAFAGCGGSSEEGAKTGQSGETAKNSENGGKGTAEFSFQATSFDLGKIEQGEKVVKGFVFKNTGDEPLVIEDASSSCGCTVPEYSDGPIAPGEEGFVDVEYDSDGKPAKQFSQSVTLKANTPTGSQKLEIKGEVVDAGGGRAGRQRQISPQGNQQQIQLGGNQNRARQQKQSGGGTDKYGRGPNDPHYQHNHPPQGQQQGGNQQRQLQTQQQSDDNGGTDQYGREPGDPHYQHNHPPQNQQQDGSGQQQIQVQPQGQDQQEQGDGETDQYGREPGDPHYQHNHPPQNQQQDNQQRQQIQPQSPKNDGDGGKDKHGRSPDDPHYQHNHPPQDN